MKKTKLKNKLVNVFTDKVLMEWEVFRYPLDEKKEDGEYMVEFAAIMLDEGFRKDTFSFFSTDNKNYTWMMDTEQRLSERSAEEDSDYEGIVGGPTIMKCEDEKEAIEYTVYILDAINAASFYYSTKEIQDREGEKKEG